MAYYTHDGVRHSTKEEALNYVEHSFISEVPPFEDEYFQALHKENWGKFELQAVPDGITNSLYLEFIRYYGEEGYSMLKFSEDHPPEDVKDVIHFLQTELPIINVVHSEIQSHIKEWSKSDKHLSITEDEDVSVELVFNVYPTEDGEGFHTVIEYTVDGIFAGEVIPPVGEKVDVIELILKHIESHILLEAEGTYRAATGEIEGEQGFVNLESMLNTASFMKHHVRIYIDAKKEKEED